MAACGTEHNEEIHSNLSHDDINRQAIYYHMDETIDFVAHHLDVRNRNPSEDSVRILNDKVASLDTVQGGSESETRRVSPRNSMTGFNRPILSSFYASDDAIMNRSSDPGTVGRPENYTSSSSLSKRSVFEVIKLKLTNNNI